MVACPSAGQVQEPARTNLTVLAWLNHQAAVIAKENPATTTSTNSTAAVIANQKIVKVQATFEYELGAPKVPMAEILRVLTRPENFSRWQKREEQQTQLERTWQSDRDLIAPWQLDRLNSGRLIETPGVSGFSSVRP